MLDYQVESLVSLGNTDSYFQSGLESRQSTSGYVFTFRGGAINWRSLEKSSVGNSTNQARSIVSMEAAWLRNFLMDMGMVPIVQLAITMVIAELLYRSRNLVAIRQENTQRLNTVSLRDSKVRRLRVSHFASGDNLADPFTEDLVKKTFDQRVERKGVKCITAQLRV